MNKNLNMIDRLKFSINPKSYINFINDKFQKAILYLLLISIFIGFIQSIEAIVAFSSVEKITINALKEDNAKFEMVNGILDFNASSLKVEDGPYLLLIDTNRELKDIDLLRSVTVHKNEGIVLLKDGFMLKRESGERTLKYSDLGLDELYINNNSLINIIDKFKFIKFILIPIIIILEFIMILMYVFLISIVGGLNTIFSRRKVSYTNILKLSSYSVTLPLLLNIIFPIQRYIVLIGGFIIIFALNYINYYQDKEKLY